MQEKEMQIAGGSLYYIEDRDSISITGMSGRQNEVHIPEMIDGMPVKSIAKKAFLSRKDLCKITLPDTIAEVGDWSFAYCDSLEQVIFPNKEISFGKAVFLECRSLSRLCIRGRGEAEAALMATAVSKADAYYLLNIMEAGSSEWLAKWDARMLDLLRRPDTEGFSKQVLCGEEDYGSTDVNVYMQEKRKAKVRLVLERSLFDVGLETEVKEEISQYLREHTKGCASEETWQVILREHGNDRPYYQLFAELSCLTEENFEGVLAEIGEEYPEMKAYFMRYKKEKIGYRDFFAGLEL